MKKALENLEARERERERERERYTRGEEKEIVGKTGAQHLT